MNEKKYVLFGAGMRGSEALDKLGIKKVMCFIDNNEKLSGQTRKGVSIISLKSFMNGNTNYIIIITPETEAKFLIAEQLEKNGLYNYVFWDDMRTREQLSFIKDSLPIEHFPHAAGYLKKLQREEWEFADRILKLVKGWGCYPFATGGTLIGALRHNGFVPWDDDMDFGLIRNDYEKLVLRCKASEEFLVIHIASTSNFKEYLKQLDRILADNPYKLILLIYRDFLKIVCGNSLFNYQLIEFFSFDYYSDAYDYEDYRRDCIKLAEKLTACKEEAQHYEIIRQAIKSNPMILKNSKSSRIYPGLDNLATMKYLDRNKDWVLASAYFPTQEHSFESGSIPIPHNPDAYMQCEYPDFRHYPKDAGLVKHDRAYVWNELKVFPCGEIVLSRGNAEEIAQLKVIYDLCRSNRVYVRFIYEAEKMLDPIKTRMLLINDEIDFVEATDDFCQFRIKRGIDSGFSGLNIEALETGDFAIPSEGKQLNGNDLVSYIKEYCHG